MVLLLLCLTCVIPCVIIGVYSDTHVLPNGDVLYMGSNKSMTFQEAEEYCIDSKLVITHEIQRDEIKSLTHNPVWTAGFRNNETGGLYIWNSTFKRKFFGLVNFTLIPMDDSKVCNDECCRLVFDPPSGKVFSVACGALNKFSTICRFYNRMEIDHKIEVVEGIVKTEQRDRLNQHENQLKINGDLFEKTEHTRFNLEDTAKSIKDDLEVVRSYSKTCLKSIEKVRSDSMESIKSVEKVRSDSMESLKSIEKVRNDSMESLKSVEKVRSDSERCFKSVEKVRSDSEESLKSIQEVRSDQKKCLKSIEKVRNDTMESLKSTNDSIDSLSGSKNTLTALVITSLLVNVIFGVLFYMLFKKVNSRS